MPNGAPQATERTLRAMLQFRVDPRGMADVSTGTSDLEKKLEALDNILAQNEQEAKKVEAAFTALGASLKTVGTREAVVAAEQLGVLTTQLNKGEIGIQEITAALDEMEETIVAAVVFQTLQKELQQLQVDAGHAKAEIQDMANTVQALESVSAEIAGLAQMVTNPLRQFAQQYVAQAGDADQASQRWLQSTEDLKAAQTALGGVVVESILPLMELTADILEKAAEFAERYPELVQAVFGIGTAVILANSLQAAVSKGIRLVADAKVILIETKRFLAAQMNRQAADKMLVAATINQRAAAAQVTGGAGGLGRGIMAGLGGLGGVAGALGVTAAIAAWTAVGLKAKDVADDVKEGTREVGDHWDKFLDDATKETASAVELADQYSAAQERVNQAYEDGGIVASLLMDREKLVNANRAKVGQALITVARSYEDYEEAVAKLNNTLGQGEEDIASRLVTKTAQVAGLGPGDEQIYKVSRATFEYRKRLALLRDEYERGEASLRDIAEAQLESNNLFARMAGMLNMAMVEIEDAMAATELVDAWTEFQDRVSAANEEYKREAGAAWDEYWQERRDQETEVVADLERIWDEYGTAALKLDLDHADEREAIIAKMGDDLVKKEDDIALQRQQAMADFQSEMTQAEENYYKERAARAAEFGLEMQRAEEDHQIAMRRMREDSGVRQTQAVRARDAIALREERRSYEHDRQRAEEDYLLNMSRRRADFARQLQQMEESFREQQAARDAAYERQLAELQKRQDDETQIIEDAAENQLSALDKQRQRDIRHLHDTHQGQADATQAHHETTMAELKRNYYTRRANAQRARNDELTDANEDWVARRQAQGVFLAGELGEIKAHYNERLTALRDWMRAANAVVITGEPAPGRAGGGYVQAGLYRVGEQGHEFVLDNPTTRMAENMAGGNLTQAGLRGMLGGGKNIQLEQVVNIHDGRDLDKTARVVREATLQVMHDLLRQVD